MKVHMHNLECVAALFQGRQLLAGALPVDAFTVRRMHT